MKIALVQCPAWTVESPPYALALLSAVLKKNNHEVFCFDLNVDFYQYMKDKNIRDNSPFDSSAWAMDFRGNVWYEKAKVEDFINAHTSLIDGMVTNIIATTAPIVGFSTQSTSKFFSLDVAKRIKERDNSKIIVFGGPLCFRNCYGIDILEDFSFLDFVCFGEGEEVFPILLESLERNAKTNVFLGFGSRLPDGTVIDGKDSALIKDLNALPFAEYRGFSLEKYVKKLVPISTSRGCVNRCTFCNESPHWQRYRRRDENNIFSEITFQLKKYPHTEMFWLDNSLINGDIKMLERLCDLFIENKLGITWGGQGMIRKEMTPKFLIKMKCAGCAVLSYGVENGSNKILQLMRKGYQAKLAKQVIRETSLAGITTIFNLVIGFPGETDVEFKENKEFILDCKKYARDIALNMLLLLKGSYLYNNLQEFNIVPINYNSPDWQLKWQTQDGFNTYGIRKQRLEELMGIIQDKAFYAFS